MPQVDTDISPSIPNIVSSKPEMVGATHIVVPAVERHDIEPPGHLRGGHFDTDIIIISIPPSIQTLHSIVQEFAPIWSNTSTMAICLQLESMLYG